MSLERGLLLVYVHHPCCTSWALLGHPNTSIGASNDQLMHTGSKCAAHSFRWPPPTVMQVLAVVTPSKCAVLLMALTAGTGRIPLCDGSRLKLGFRHSTDR